MPKNCEARMRPNSMGLLIQNL